MSMKGRYWARYWRELQEQVNREALADEVACAPKPKRRARWLWALIGAR